MKTLTFRRIEMRQFKSPFWTPPHTSLFWEKVGVRMEEEEIRTQFNGDRKKCEEFYDEEFRKIIRLNTHRRFVVKQFLNESDHFLSNIESNYELPIKQIIEKEILNRIPTHRGKIGN